MRILFTKLSVTSFFIFAHTMASSTQQPSRADSISVAQNDSVIQAAMNEDLEAAIGSMGMVTESNSVHQFLRVKFIEGNTSSMSLVALVLILGLAFCIERIIYLSSSEIDAKRLMTGVATKIESKDLEGAKQQCQTIRGPVASLCYEGLNHVDEPIENIEHSVASYGSVQTSNLEKGCSWITLFIAMVPSLGFLGTVIGMIMTSDQIQMAGDISPTIVTTDMRVALITTIFGVIMALILQVFYSCILSKMDHITAQMGESAIILLGALMKHKLSK